MIRPLALSLAAGLALVTASLSGATQSVQTSGAYESFPVVHREPITIRILSGKSGQPLPHLHLLLIGGYDQRDLHAQLFRAEALTDALGQARLDGQLANLPWLQVWVNKKPLCQADPRRASFSVERIRRDGLSSPNRCGVVAVEDAPGVFTVFVQSKEKKAPAKLTQARAESPDLKPDAAPAATSTVKNLARHSDGTEASSWPPSASAFVRRTTPAAALGEELPARQPDGAETFVEPSAQSSSDLVRPSGFEIPAVVSTAPLVDKTLTQRPGAAQSPMQPPGATPVPARPSVVAGIPAVVATAPFGPETPLQSSAAAFVRPPAAVEAGLPASYPLAIPVAAALPAALKKASAKTNPRAAAPASTEASSTAARMAPAGARESVREKTRRAARLAEEKSKMRRARLLSHRARRVSRSAELVSRRARLDAQKARPLPQKAKPAPASGQPPPAEKAARAAAWAKTGKSPVTPPANAASATGPSKPPAGGPPAGAKPAAATPGKASAPPKPGNPGAPPKP